MTVSRVSSARLQPSPLALSDVAPAQVSTSLPGVQREVWPPRTAPSTQNTADLAPATGQSALSMRTQQAALADAVQALKEPQSAREILLDAYDRSQILAIGHAEHGPGFAVHALVHDLLSVERIRLDPRLRFIAIEASAQPELAHALARMSLPDAREDALSPLEREELRANMKADPERWAWYAQFLPALRQINTERAAHGLAPIVLAPTDAVPSLRAQGPHVPSDATVPLDQDYVSQPKPRETKAATNFLKLLTRPDGSVDEDTRVIVAWHILHLARGHRSAMACDGPAAACELETTAWLEYALAQAPQLSAHAQVVFFDQRSTNPAHNPERGLAYDKLGADPEAILAKGFRVPAGLAARDVVRTDSVFFTYNARHRAPTAPQHVHTMFDAVIVG